MTQTFHEVTPVQITFGATGSWTDVDIDSYISELGSDVTGVVLHVVNTSSSTYGLGLRKNGSTDNRTGDIAATRHCWAAIGVDSSHIFEAYIADNDVDVYIVGYTTTGVTFFTNAVNKSLSATSAWTDINCSSSAPSAVGLIFEITSTSDSYKMGLRKNGSTDDRNNYATFHSCFGWMVGCDTSQICEGYITSTVVDFYLVGYITDGATFETNATDLSLSSTGSYYDLTALPSASIFGFIEVYGGSYFHLRKNGSSEDYYYYASLHPMAFVPCDTSHLIEGKIASTNVDFWLLGYAINDITEKTSSDTGSGSDAKVAYPAVTHSRTETGSGADTKGSSPAAAHSRADVGAATELSALLVAWLRAETGSGVDAKLSLLVALLRTETGAGSESIVSRAIALSETATGIERILNRDITLGDAGIGADVNALCKTLLLTDSGSAFENSYIHIIDFVLTSADDGTGVEASVPVLAAFNQNDTGSAIDAVVARALFAKEYPAGAIDLAKTITATLQGAETGAGVELSLLALLKQSAETGVGSEAASSILALFSRADSGHGTEAITIFAAMIAQDTGAGVEAVLAMLKKAFDSGHGVEAMSLIGAVGRAMRLMAYVQSYRDLKVYTSEV